jgi:hypothetical protein
VSKTFLPFFEAAKEAGDVMRLELVTAPLALVLELLAGPEPAALEVLPRLF